MSLESTDIDCLVLRPSTSTTHAVMLWFVFFSHFIFLTDALFPVSVGDRLEGDLLIEALFFFFID